MSQNIVQKLNTNKTNKKKQKQLGMAFGTANGKLRKIVMFYLAKKSGLNVCFRCNHKITKVEDFSIDHKKPWLDENVEYFWNIRNIAFSHLRCNSGAGRRQIAAHGTAQRYWKHRCRCKECTQANTNKHRKYREKVKMRR